MQRAVRKTKSEIICSMSRHGCLVAAMAKDKETELQREMSILRASIGVTGKKNRHAHRDLVAATVKDNGSAAEREEYAATVHWTDRKGDSTCTSLPGMRTRQAGSRSMVV